MKDLTVKAFESHPMFEGISLTNCETLTNCLGCTQKTYMKDQIISTAGLGSLTPRISKRLI